MDAVQGPMPKATVNDARPRLHPTSNDDRDDRGAEDFEGRHRGKLNRKRKRRIAAKSLSPPPEVPRVRAVSERREESTASNAFGLGMASTILLAWTCSLVLLLNAPLHGPWVWLWAPLAVAWMSWLFTGLFITGHDAMHGSVTRAHPRLNHAIGAVAVAAYAMFDYRMLRRAHGRHHARPARAGDPDWHDGRRSGAGWWFLAFVGRYLTVGQLSRLLFLFWGVQLIVETPNFLAFWALPSLLSVGQLFYFGTYLPHRSPAGGHTNPHHAYSTSLTQLGSLLTCFHFGGYHREHHENPTTPWWRLPSTAPSTRVQGHNSPGAGLRTSPPSAR